MPRLIDADKAKEVLTKLLYETALNNSGGASLMCEDIAENRLETWLGLVPTVEAKPVRHGHWIEGNNFHWYSNSCSCCGYTRITDIKSNGWNQWKYCPNCGAKMDKTEECLLMPKADESTIKIGNGHWIVDRLISDQTVMSTVYKCSECGDTSIVAYKTCPNCGAKMDEEDEDVKTD